MLSLKQLKGLGLEVVEEPVKDSEVAQELCELAKVQRSMELLAQTLGLSSARFLAVEPSYYDQELDWRRDRLGAEAVEELCKSVVLEPLGAVSCMFRAPTGLLLVWKSEIEHRM